ncbi:MAG: glycosyl hydrolase 53 family protein, partial [Planctomycetota bacterium]
MIEMLRFMFFQACLLPLITNGATAQGIWLGADLSYVNELEDFGAVYRDNGNKRDVYELFAEKGANIARLRLWHTPDWTSYSTLKDVKRSIRRARNAGMAILLDFHYSDDWADPGDQIVPKAWEGLDENELTKAVYQYSCRVLQELDDEGLMPEIVQVGNEINTEILLPEKVSENKTIDWARNAKLINAGIRAVREVGRTSKVTPKVMLHIAQPENVRPWIKDA